MKRLLQILAVCALTTTPLAMSVVACGSDIDDANEVSENDNVVDLLNEAEAEINRGLGKLVDESKNLTFENEFDNHQDITKVLRENSEITEDIKASFLKRLQNDINSYVVDQYLQQPIKFKSLFGNIATNEILKINIDKTTLTKEDFKWEKKDNVDFNIKNYDPKTFGIEMWYKLNVNLTLSLAYKDESNKDQAKDINTNYDFNYANEGAELGNLVQEATNHVEESLKNIVLEVKTDSTNKNDDINFQKAIAKQQIMEKFPNKDKPKIKVNQCELDTAVLKKSDEYDSGEIFYKAITKNNVQQTVTALKEHLTPIKDKFTTDVENWINEKNIALSDPNEQNKINSFGECVVSNWSFSGLRLKTINLNFVNLRTNETREQWVTNTATVLGTIFCTKGDFAKGRLDLTTDGDLTLYMNPTDFDNFLQEDKNLKDVSDYFESEISKLASKDSKLNYNQKGISFSFNGLWEKNPTLNDRRVVKKIDYKTLKIARGAGNMHGYNYLNIKYNKVAFLSGSVKNYKNKYILFNNWIIKRADTNVW